MAGTGVGVGITDRVSKVTISKWLKKLGDEGERNMALLPILRKKGRVLSADGGGEVRWIFRYKYHELLGHIDGQARPYTRLNPYLDAALNWAYYEMEDSATPIELAQNKGDAAMFKIFDQKMVGLQKSAAQKIAKQFYNDDSVSQTGIPRPLSGIQSMMSFDTQTATDEYQTTSDDTYAGVSTSRTSLKADAVEGTDEEYGAWSPVGVNANRTVGGAAVPWADNPDGYLRAGLIKAQITSAKDDMVDLVLLTQSSWKDLLNVLQDKERKVVSNEFSESAYGFQPGSSLQFEGAVVNWDYAIPSTDADSYSVHGYGWNTSKMALHVLDVPGFSRPKDSLFGFAEFRDPHTAGWLWRLLFAGQLVFESPRYFVKWSKFAA